MAAPKYIRDKAEQLDKALNRVAKLSFDLQNYYESKTDAERGQQFFYEQRLDIPWEFDLQSVLHALDEVSEQ